MWVGAVGRAIVGGQTASNPKELVMRSLGSIGRAPRAGTARPRRRRSPIIAVIALVLMVASAVDTYVPGRRERPAAGGRGVRGVRW